MNSFLVRDSAALDDHALLQRCERIDSPLVSIAKDWFRRIASGKEDSCLHCYVDIALRDYDTAAITPSLRKLAEGRVRYAFTQPPTVAFYDLSGELASWYGFQYRSPDPRLSNTVYINWALHQLYDHYTRTPNLFLSHGPALLEVFRAKLHHECCNWFVFLIRVFMCRCAF